MKRAVALLILAATAFAPQASATASCAIIHSATLINFSVYNAFDGQVDTSGTITLNCTTAPPLNLPVGYEISISAGGSGSYSQRLMGGQMKYNLYSDATRLLIWGNGVLGSGTVKPSGTCAGVCGVTVYGRLNGAQSAPAGTYNDSVVVTVDY